MKKKDHHPSPELMGFHNANLASAQSRLVKGNTYKDLSTVCVIPTRGMIHAKVVQSWMAMMTPMNQKFMRLMMSGLEVGEAYEQAVQQIIAHPDLSKWKFMLTLEEDNMPPPDGLMKLLESIESEQLDAVGGLYWTKGEAGQPMIYGNPAEMPRNFIPQLPQAGTIQRCNGLGMGFTLFRLEMFKSGKIQPPFFKTLQDYKPYVGSQVFTQDLFFFSKACDAGFKIASDTRVLVGHYDASNDFTW